MSAADRIAPLLVALLALPVAAAPAAARETAPAKLPFVALQSDQDIFASSEFTKAYAPDRTYVLRAPQLRRTDVARLDRWGWFPANDVPIPKDEGETGRVQHQTSPKPEEIVPQDEVRADQPAQAGVHVGIPGAVAATGAALGGLVLLAQIVAGLFF